MISVTSPYQVICERQPPREIKSLMNLPPRERAVSYTHLDVYKRQEEGWIN